MNITRNIKEKCVMARVRRLTVRHQKNFTLKQYATWDAAERAALRWVKGMIKTLPPPVSSKDRMTRRNHSGVVGVHLGSQEHKRPYGKVYVYWFWIARWPNCPSLGGIPWSINKYGDKDAFVLAVLSRRHETVKRDYVLDEFKKIKNKKEYDEILNLRK